MIRQAPIYPGLRGSVFGQGLMETIVSIGIITTGIIGSLALIIGGLSAGKQSADQLVAANIAWEGIEVIKNIRDSNYLAGVAWDSGLNGGDTTSIVTYDPGTNDWSLDFNPNAITDNAAKIYRLPGGAHVQSTATPSGTATIFSRLITIDPQGTAFMKRVISEVRWMEKGSVKTLQAETSLYNWR